MHDVSVPLPIRFYPSPRDFQPEPESVYFYSISEEDRSRQSLWWDHGGRHVLSVELADMDDPDDLYHFKEVKDGAASTVSSRDQNSLNSLISDYDGMRLYLDITGMSHHVWAAVIKACHDKHNSLTIIYTEPSAYRYSQNPTAGSLFDLSERIRGIHPLPGLATIGAAGGDDFILVALLGFEGARFAYMLEQVEPEGHRIIPIVGVPGFRAEYPFFTYQGNMTTLSQSKAWRNVHYAPANCPFSVVAVLKEVSARFPGHRARIAMIGTKPHAVGAVLYKLWEDPSAELVYDHPVHRATRTVGANRLLAYSIDMTDNE